MLRTGYRDVLTVLEKVDPKFKDDDYRLSNAESFVRGIFTFPDNPHYGFKLHLNQNRSYLDRLIANPDWSWSCRRENILNTLRRKLQWSRGRALPKKARKLRKQR